MLPLTNLPTPVPCAPEHDSDDYFGNPYRSGYEQYGLEFIDRQADADEDISRVVILGYN